LAVVIETAGADALDVTCSAAAQRKTGDVHVAKLQAKQIRPLLLVTRSPFPADRLWVEVRVASGKVERTVVVVRSPVPVQVLRVVDPLERRVPVRIRVDHTAMLDVIA
jgi:hypothetical protein